ncbi:MAG: hypothetical protein MRJ96_01025 [Nitrospirales bacterium]|nr:hypothetical protein [Nitrospira sp.]MDR4500024.1 hypothetical protein [Nitrospirales bacterium]
MSSHQNNIFPDTCDHQSVFSQDEHIRILDEFLKASIAQHSTASARAGSLPFHAYDITAGTENEYQAVVIGDKHSVDLPISLESSNFFKNIVRQSCSGLSSRSVVTELEQFLDQSAHTVWENSWVRFPLRRLSHFAHQVLQHDLLADKKQAAGPRRSDIGKFVFSTHGEDWLRVPISYVLRLALADVISAAPHPHHLIRQVGEQLMNHYLNDNTSPETFSFYVIEMSPKQTMGRAVGREASKRYLLSQLLVMYANQKFDLLKNGQRAMIYFAPHPPIQQKTLNRLISDSYYRDLFMNPCLSGWDSGEDKHHYMALCHQVLSRSHVNAIAKLKNAGIIKRNLVTLPTPSNISLANNGTHISLGSRTLTAMLNQSPNSGLSTGEKYVGDLVIKIVEHFLPLFVGTYSAAPYRLDFWDFHPEQVLGFLAHELDHTYLQLLWQRWKRKAGLKILGTPLTPIGPLWMDKLLSKHFGLKGDFIPDFRLIDYLVVLPSTDQCPALDGTLGNDLRLKRDLGELGIYDERMSLYLLYKLRACSERGFSGFEGRYYSLFESLLDDMAEAADLQALLTALAFRYIYQYEVTHAHIPDTPSIESERRQLFFGAALHVPTFYVRADSRNLFLKKILSKMSKIRLSHRFPEYIRAHHHEYRRALLSILREDAQDLVEQFGLGDFLDRLAARLESPSECSTFGKLTKGIQEQAGVSSPLKLSGEECNAAAEAYYRTTLRTRHMQEGLACLREDCQRLDSDPNPKLDPIRRMARSALGTSRTTTEFLDSIRMDILEESASLTNITKLIRFTLLTVHLDMDSHSESTSPSPAPTHEPHCTSVH